MRYVYVLWLMGFRGFKRPGNHEKGNLLVAADFIGDIQKP